MNSRRTSDFGHVSPLYLLASEQILSHNPAACFINPGDAIVLHLRQIRSLHTAEPTFASKRILPSEPHTALAAFEGLVVAVLISSLFWAALVVTITRFR